MGWMYSHKPHGVKTLDYLRDHCMGREWWDKHIVAASAGFNAAWMVHESDAAPDESVYVPDERGKVRAILVLHVKHERNPRDGMNFGYKDMTETMGPYECECPLSIIAAASPLQALTPENSTDAPDWAKGQSFPTSLASAHEYRARSIAKAGTKAAKRGLKEGAQITLAQPATFTDGHKGASFIVTKRGKRVLFRAADNSCLYRISARLLEGATVA